MGKGEIVGLVGRNGSGKSTLLKIFTGAETADAGSFKTPAGYRLGYLDQHIHFTKDTLLEECCQALSEDEKYDHYKAEIILFGLGFVESDLTRPPTEFSGGFQLRINLTKTLLKDPDLLLLDEPTNYLDILSLRWLRRFLKSFRGEAIIVTHDRDFMDTVTTHTMGIHRGRLFKVKGGTEKYYGQILIDEDVHERTRERQEKKIKELRGFVDRFGAKASKAAQAKSKQKQIERMKVMVEMRREETLGFRFNYKPTQAKTAMEVDGLAFSYTGDVSDGLFSDLTFTVKPGDRVAVIGKNGKGKTTLLNVLAGRFSPTEGAVRVHPGTSVGFYEQTNRKDLAPSNTVAEEIAAANTALTTTESRGICGAMMFSGDLAEKKISVLSGGEQSRVLLGKVIAHPANLLLLDEPSNHLDMDSIQVMADEIEAFKGGVVIVTHNEEMLRLMANKLVVFHEDRADFFHGTYDEFLDGVGWEEEGPLRAPKKAGKDKKGKGKRSEEARQLKEKVRRLKTLKKEYAALEASVAALEDELKEKNDEMIKTVSEKGVGGRIKELSLSIDRLQLEIEKGYLRMELVMEEMEGQEEGE